MRKKSQHRGWRERKGVEGETERRKSQLTIWMVGGAKKKYAFPFCLLLLSHSRFDMWISISTLDDGGLHGSGGGH